MRIRALVVSTVCVLATMVAGAQRGPWEIEDSGSAAGLRGVHAVGGGVVWASGTGWHGTAQRGHWIPLAQCAMPPDAGKLDFRGIWAWDALDVLILSSGPGDLSRLYQTSDGCSSWRLVLTNPDPAGFWDGLIFIDRQHGLIMAIQHTA